MQKLFQQSPIFFSTKDDIKNQMIACILSHSFTGEILSQRWKFSV